MKSSTITNTNPSRPRIWNRCIASTLVKAWICIFGASASLADSYTVDLLPGWTLIANQLDNGSNNLRQVIPVVPENTLISLFDNQAGSNYFASFLNGSWNTDPPFRPGDGAAIMVPTNCSLTFTGQLHTPVLPVPLGTNVKVLSRQTPSQGNWEDIVGFPPSEGASVFRLPPGSADPRLLVCGDFRHYNAYLFTNGAWSPSAPVLNIGESATFTTNLLYRPFITLQPSNQTVQICEDVNLNVEATGYPSVCYQWQFNGTDIPGAISNSYTIFNATPAANGLYSAVVSTPLAAATSVLAQVTVNVSGAPDITLTPDAAARGFVLTTFAYNFPPVPSGNYLGGPGPLATAFTTNRHVLVTHLSSGKVYEFLNDNDGQDAATVVTTPINGGLAGLAQIATTNGAFKYYMCIQTGSVYEVNQQGIPIQLIVNIDHATGLVAVPPNVSGTNLIGHLLVSTAGGTENSIWDVDPVAKTRTLFSSLAADGLGFTQDGRTLLLAESDLLIGLNVLDGTTNFQYNVPATDGIIAAAGTLLGKAYVNCTDGKLWEVDLATGNKTLIARCGSRGDFLYSNPFDGSLFITQSDRIKRLRFPGADFFAVPGLTISILGTNVTLCWPTAYPGFHLERTASLQPAAWTPVSIPPVGGNGQFCISVAITNAGTGFFRLAR